MLLAPPKQPMRGIAGKPIKGGPNDPLASSFKIANAATEQQAGDYSNIMDAYKKVLADPNSTGTYNPTTSPYQQSGQQMQAIGNLGDLATTGGYSQQNIADIRARGMSPIRAMYANASRDIDRQRGLQGGYSPNYGALKAKMAREMSSTLSDKMTDVNAGIAQSIAQNRLASAGGFASAAGAESNLANQTAMQNAQIQNEAGQFNAQNKTGQQQNLLQGMTSLYGTTPALANTFGNQAMNSAQLQNQITQQNKDQNLRKIGMMMG